MRGCWITETDADLLQAAARNSGRGEWHIEAREPSFMHLRKAALDLLHGNDFIVFPLSLPEFWSLRLPEIANRIGSATRLLLWSRTDADPEALSSLFDGVFTPHDSMTEVLLRAERPATRRRAADETGRLINIVLRTATSFNTSHDGGPPPLELVREGPPKTYGSHPRSSHSNAHRTISVPIPGTPEVFVVSAAADKRWLRMLRVHLKPLEERGRLALFTEEMVAPGQDRRSVLAERIRCASAAVVIVSADLLASETALDGALAVVLEEHRRRALTVLPIIARPCRYDHLRDLAALEPLNSPDAPLSTLKKADVEQAFKRTSDRIDLVVNGEARGDVTGRRRSDTV